MHSAAWDIASFSWLSAAIAPMVREQEAYVTELRRMPEGWWAVGFVALVLAACWLVMGMYRREGRRGASSTARIALGLLRCSVLLILAIILLEPVSVRIVRRWVDSYTIVLVDDSSSMDLADTYRTPEAATRVNSMIPTNVSEGVRRRVIVDAMLTADNRAWLTELANNNRVKVYWFSNEPELRGTIRSAGERESLALTEDTNESLTGKADDVSLEMTAAGPVTNLDRAMRLSVESLGSAPIAGVVVLSDGGFNEGGHAADIARYAKSRDIAVFTVGVGDASPPRNVRVTETLAPENAVQRDPFSVTAKVVAQGVEGEPLLVELLEKQVATGIERVVDTRRLTRSAGQTESVSFERRQDRVGRYTYTVRVPEVEAESVVDDNSQQVTVNVIDARTRVLVISGGPSWDYRFLTRLLERDDTIDVSCWLQSADLSSVRDGNTIIDHLPRLPEELLEYDAIILMDPDVSEFDQEWAQLADRFVAVHGGGLLYAAARAHSPTFLRETSLSSLLDLLPVVLDPEADLVLNRIGHYQTKPAPIDIPEASFHHNIMRLAGDVVATKLAWRGLSYVYWHYPVLRAKPAATVLMRNGDPRMRRAWGGHVLAAVQFVGAGRSGFLAFDGTWRWRRSGAEIFDRFWIQMIRYLSEGKLLGGTKRGLLLTERDRYAIGESVTITARLLDQQFEPMRKHEVRATFEIDGEKSDFMLTPQRDRAGWYEGRFVPTRNGMYRIEVQVPGRSAAELTTISREVRVSRPNIEVLKPQMDRDKLNILATQSKGGKYFEVDELGDIPALIPDRHEEVSVRSRPTSLWDNGWSLTLLIGLLSVEWFYRKWMHLL